MNCLKLIPKGRLNVGKRHFAGFIHSILSTPARIIKLKQSKGSITKRQNVYYNVILFILLYKNSLQIVYYHILYSDNKIQIALSNSYNIVL